eukprot:31176-Pelagococcus_subviridis.AAC.12
MELHERVVHRVVVRPQARSAAGATHHGAEVRVVVVGAPEQVARELELGLQVRELLQRVRGFLTRVLSYAPQVQPRLLRVFTRRRRLFRERLEEVAELHDFVLEVFSHEIEVRAVAHVHADVRGRDGRLRREVRRRPQPRRRSEV